MARIIVKHKRLIVVLVGLLTIIIVVGGYKFGWEWTGLTNFRQPDQVAFERGKTLWDWLSLLIAPLALAAIARWLDQRSARNQYTAQQDRFSEDALQNYFDKMSELLVDKSLRQKGENDPVMDIARVRTVTILRRLNRERIIEVLDFLRDADLYSGEKSVFQGAKMININLSKINLWRANMSRANLRNANFNHSNLYGINLENAKLCGADFRGANLERARMKGATIDENTLFDTKTILKHGDHWTPTTIMTIYGVILGCSDDDNSVDDE